MQIVDQLQPTLEMDDDMVSDKELEEMFLKFCETYMDDEFGDAHIDVSGAVAYYDKAIGQSMLQRMVVPAFIATASIGLWAAMPQSAGAEFHQGFISNQFASKALPMVTLMNHFKLWIEWHCFN